MDDIEFTPYEPIVQFSRVGGFLVLTDTVFNILDVFIFVFATSFIVKPLSLMRGGHNEMEPKGALSFAVSFVCPGKFKRTALSYFVSFLKIQAKVHQ